jgi:hypothetical protein
MKFHMNLVTRLQAGWSRFQIPAGTRDFSLLQNIQTNSGPTQPPIQWALRAFALGAKQPRHEPEHSHLSAKVKNEWCCSSMPSTSLNGVHRDNFTFYGVPLEAT